MSTKVRRRKASQRPIVLDNKERITNSSERIADIMEKVVENFNFNATPNMFVPPKPIESVYTETESDSRAEVDRLVVRLIEVCTNAKLNDIDKALQIVRIQIFHNGGYFEYPTVSKLPVTRTT